MKYIFSFLCACMMICMHAGFAQHAPEWTRSISSSPDTAYVAPVRSITDAAGNIYVLSRYSKNQGGGISLQKIFLDKYHSDSTLQWRYVYDSAMRGQPVARDLALDDSGNCYVAGNFYNASSNEPMLLMKVTSSGVFSWLRDSCTSFRNNDLDQLIFQDNRLYTKGYAGLLVTDKSGAEQWSAGLAVQALAVDHSGNTIITVYVGAVNNLFKFDTGGNILFVDSAMPARRIAIDYNNNFFLAMDLPYYELAKYDSAGNIQWNRTNFPAAPPFGDIYFDVVPDLYGDVLAVGFNDTMYKFSSSGALIWVRPMDGLDSYLGKAFIVYSNMLLVAGSVPDSNGYNMEVRLYDVNGHVSWTGSYNAVTQAQEYLVDAAIDYSGIYGVETTGDSATLVKFALSAIGVPDYSLLCVDSVWYDADPQFIHVRVFNGNIMHLNYPSVQIVSPMNDTIGNPSDFVNFFAHLGNAYQVYTDTITQSGIPDFSNYTFLIHEDFGDTTFVMGWCTPVGVPEITQTPVMLFPNPAQDHITLKWEGSEKPYTIEVMDNVGAVVKRVIASGPEVQVDIGGMSQGMYVIRLQYDRGVVQKKFVIAD